MEKGGQGLAWVHAWVRLGSSLGLTRVWAGSGLGPGRGKK